MNAAQRSNAVYLAILIGALAPQIIGACAAGMYGGAFLLLVILEVCYHVGKQ